MIIYYNCIYLEVYECETHIINETHKMIIDWYSFVATLLEMHGSAVQVATSSKLTNPWLEKVQVPSGNWKPLYLGFRLGRKANAPCSSTDG